MAVKMEDILVWMLGQRGDRYIFGTEVSSSNPNPTAFDCSELVEWACARVGLVPKMPDGAYYQWKHSKALAIPVTTGYKTRGALMFVGDGTGVGRDAITHVAVSLGDNTVVEARGSKWGVGVWPSIGRSFSYAAKIPGATYTKPIVPIAQRPTSRPAIFKGCTGFKVHVMYLQTVLRKCSFVGLDGKPIVVDGDFGRNTDWVVRAIQGYTKLTVDGVVGPKTWGVIDHLNRSR